MSFLSIFFLFIPAASLPTESVVQCSSADDSDKLDKLSEMVQGLEKKLLDMKKDVALQVRHKYVRVDIDEAE